MHSSCFWMRKNGLLLFWTHFMLLLLSLPQSAHNCHISVLQQRWSQMWCWRTVLPHWTIQWCWCSAWRPCWPRETAVTWACAFRPWTRTRWRWSRSTRWCWPYRATCLKISYRPVTPLRWSSERRQTVQLSLISS